MQDFDIIPSRAKRYYLPIADREVAQLAIYYAYYNIHKWMIAVILLWNERFFQKLFLSLLFLEPFVSVSKPLRHSKDIRNYHSHYQHFFIIYLTNMMFHILSQFRKTKQLCSYTFFCLIVFNFVYIGFDNVMISKTGIKSGSSVMRQWTKSNECENRNAK